MLCFVNVFFVCFFAFMENSLLAYQNEERNDLFKASFVLDNVLDVVLEVCIYYKLLFLLGKLVVVQSGQVCLGWHGTVK